MPADEIAAASRETLRVETRLDDGHLIPLRFGHDGSMRDVVELVDHWPGDGHCYFRVRDAGGGLYILRHDERTRRWDIHAFESVSAHLSTLDAGRTPARTRPEGSQ